MNASKLETPKKNHQIRQSVSAKPTIASEEVSERAFHLWLQRGCAHGFDIEDWLQAESELLDRDVLMIDDPMEGDRYDR